MTNIFKIIGFKICLYLKSLKKYKKIFKIIEKKLPRDKNVFIEIWFCGAASGTVCKCLPTLFECCFQCKTHTQTRTSTCWWFHTIFLVAADITWHHEDCFTLSDVIRSVSVVFDFNEYCNISFTHIYIFTYIHTHIYEVILDGRLKTKALFYEYGILFPFHTKTSALQVYLKYTLLLVYKFIYFIYAYICH